MAYLNQISVDDVTYDLRQNYPVGAIYLSTDATSPASLFGGTWERIAEGRTLYGAGTLGDTTYTAGGTVDAGLPNITAASSHNTNSGSIWAGGFTGAFYGIKATHQKYAGNPVSASAAVDIAFDASRSDAVYGASDTVQPAAYVVYMWRRIS